MSCAAPNCNQIRVSKYHCEYHAELFKPSYLKYKQAEAQIINSIQQIEFNQCSVTELLLYYAKVRGVYQQRVEYRNRAFKREHWDSGHEFRLDLLLTIMFCIESNLRIKFDVAQVEPSDENKEITIDNESIIDLDDQLIEIDKFNQRAVDDELTWNETIPMYVNEYLAIKQQHNKIFGLVNKLMDDFSRRQLNSDDETRERFRIGCTFMYPTLLSFIEKRLNSRVTDGSIDKIFVYRRKYHRTGLCSLMGNITGLKSLYLILLRCPYILELIWSVNQRCKSKLLTWKTTVESGVGFVDVIINYIPGCDGIRFKSCIQLKRGASDNLNDFKYN